jgi:hypothetical protein
MIETVQTMVLRRSHNDPAPTQLQKFKISESVIYNSRNGIRNYT